MPRRSKYPLLTGHTSRDVQWYAIWPPFWNFNFLSYTTTRCHGVQKGSFNYIVNFLHRLEWRVHVLIIKDHKSNYSKFMSFGSLKACSIGYHEWRQMASSSYRNCYYTSYLFVNINQIKRMWGEALFSIALRAVSHENHQSNGWQPQKEMHEKKIIMKGFYFVSWLFHRKIIVWKSQ